jgi:hypothetical protein
MAKTKTRKNPNLPKDFWIVYRRIKCMHPDWTNEHAGLVARHAHEATHRQ